MYVHTYVIRQPFFNYHPIPCRGSISRPIAPVSSVVDTYAQHCNYNSTGHHCSKNTRACMHICTCVIRQIRMYAQHWKYISTGQYCSKNTRACMYIPIYICMYLCHWSDTNVCTALEVYFHWPTLQQKRAWCSSFANRYIWFGGWIRTRDFAWHIAKTKPLWPDGHSKCRTCMNTFQHSILNTRVNSAFGNIYSSTDTLLPILILYYKH
jgi:hypothetical protein